MLVVGSFADGHLTGHKYTLEASRNIWGSEYTNENFLIINKASRRPQILVLCGRLDIIL